MEVASGPKEEEKEGRGQEDAQDEVVVMDADVSKEGSALRADECDDENDENAASRSNEQPVRSRFSGRVVGGGVGEAESKQSKKSWSTPCVLAGLLRPDRRPWVRRR